jgi:hypothetical protein
MSAILLAALFGSSGLFAITVIRRNWQRYGSAAVALRGELRDCSEWREVLVTVREITVHPTGGAVVLRPDFRGRDRGPAPAYALPAAA